jgi:hypothetical protein
MSTYQDCVFVIHKTKLFFVFFWTPKENKFKNKINPFQITSIRHTKFVRDLRRKTNMNVNTLWSAWKIGELELSSQQISRSIQEVINLVK